MARHLAVALSALAILAAACTGGDAAATDTSVAEVPVDDTAEVSAPVVIQQSQPERRLGRMDLLQPPQSGTCAGDGDPANAIRYTYEGDWPMRTVRLELASSARRMLEVASTQRAGAYDETESVYVLFDSAGAIQQGTRRYYSSETPPARESGSLLPSDTAAILQLAEQVLDWCRRPAGVR